MRSASLAAGVPTREVQCPSCGTEQDMAAASPSSKIQWRRFPTNTPSPYVGHAPQCRRHRRRGVGHPGVFLRSQFGPDPEDCTKSSMRARWFFVHRKRYGFRRNGGMEHPRCCVLSCWCPLPYRSPRCTSRTPSTFGDASTDSMRNMVSQARPIRKRWWNGTVHSNAWSGPFHCSLAQLGAGYGRACHRHCGPLRLGLDGARIHGVIWSSRCFVDDEQGMTNVDFILAAVVRNVQLVGLIGVEVNRIPSRGFALMHDV